mmetsp:Transcript_36587/g.88476  ORF Transcript_36587/g.88476 Transcript_36587/m.88476 type:complete len:276 (-) Transcript_36587:18-845(-)
MPPNIFEASAPGEHAKVWGQLLRSLSKVGNELFLEVYREQVVLRTLNASKSAFVTASFKSSFFETYEVSDDLDKCKVMLKPACSAFKNTSNLSEFRIRYDCNASKLVFEMRCKSGIIKRYQLHYEQCNVMMAVYSKERCPSKVVLTARPLNDCLANFHTSVDQITMSASPSALQWQAVTSGMQTESSFHAGDLEKFQIGRDTTLVFGLRELRAMVQFWESQSCTMSIHFDRPGNPIIFSGEYPDMTFDGDMVIATLADGGDGGGDDATQVGTPPT